MLACSLARTDFASDSARPSSASVPPTTGRPIVTSSVVSTSPVSVLASSRTVHRIRPALVVRPQPGQSARDRQAACPRFLTLPGSDRTPSPGAIDLAAGANHPVQVAVANQIATPPATALKVAGPGVGLWAIEIPTRSSASSATPQ